MSLLPSEIKQNMLEALVLVKEKTFSLFSQKQILQKNDIYEENEIEEEEFLKDERLSALQKISSLIKPSTTYVETDSDNSQEEEIEENLDKNERFFALKSFLIIFLMNLKAFVFSLWPQKKTSLPSSEEGILFEREQKAWVEAPSSFPKASDSSPHISSKAEDDIFNALIKRSASSQKKSGMSAIFARVYAFLTFAWLATRWREFWQKIALRLYNFIPHFPNQNSPVAPVKKSGGLVVVEVSNLDDAPIGLNTRESSVRWEWIYILFIRLISCVWLLKGVSYWMIILGLGVVPFEEDTLLRQGLIVGLTLINSAAGVGLWLLSPWGKNLWILAIVIEIVLGTTGAGEIVSASSLIGLVMCLFFFMILTYAMRYYKEDYEPKMRN